MAGETAGGLPCDLSILIQNYHMPTILCEYTVRHRLLCQGADTAQAKGNCCGCHCQFRYSYHAILQSALRVDFRTLVMGVFAGRTGICCLYCFCGTLCQDLFDRICVFHTNQLLIKAAIEVA